MNTLQSRRSVVLTVLLLMATGCEPNAAPPAGPTRLAPVLGQIRSRIPRSDPDEELALLDDQIGLGGVSFGPDGALEVQLIGETNGNARAAIAREYVESVSRKVSNIRIKQAQFHFRDLVKWKQIIGQSNFDGLTMLSASSLKNRVVLGVISEKAGAVARQRLHDL